MSKLNLNYMPVLLAICLVAGIAFLADGRQSNAAGPTPIPTVVVNTTVNVGNGVVTPTLDNALGGLRGALPNLPSFADFQKQNPPNTQPAQAAAPPEPIPHADSATGHFDPTLGKIVIVDGLSRKLKCDGLERNPDFAGLTEAQKTLAQDICAHL